MASSDLQIRRLDAVRAWTSFVEHGDAAEPVVRPEILTSWTRSEAAISPDVTEAPLADESETAGVLAGLAAADRRRAGRGRAAPYRRGRRPRRRRHRPADPDPVDVRRPRDAPQGRDGQLRGRRPLGRRVRRHQRARPGQPPRHPGDGLQRRALRLDRAQLGLLGRAGARPRHRRPARRHRPLDHLGPHPPDRPGDRPGDGPADRDGDAALGIAPAPSAASRTGPSRAW